MSINTFFILASSSKSRFSILKNMGLNFKKINHRCNEKYHKKALLKFKYKPSKISLELSKLKAKSLKIQNKLIIGSDTIIDFKGKIIDKTTSLLRAKKKIQKLSPNIY